MIAVMSAAHAVIHVEPQRCELQAVDAPAPGPDQIAGSTLASLISPVTELHSAYDGGRFPTGSGYAAVFTVEAVGAAVDGWKPGDRAFCMGGHRSWQCVDAAMVVPVLAGLAAAEAVLARLMAVSHTTLITTRARAGDTVAIAGLGPVGYLAAAQFALAGYRVVACDPDPGRRALAGALDSRVVEGLQPGLDAALSIDCSGHEDAVLACCDATGKLGEVVLVGVPWRQHSQASAHELLRRVFHDYLGDGQRARGEALGGRINGGLAAADDALRDFAIELTLPWLDIAVALGCPYVRNNTGGPGPGQADADGAVERCAESFRQLCDAAAERGIGMVIENHGGISSDIDKLDRLFDLVARDNLKQAVDFGNWPAERRRESVARSAHRAGASQDARLRRPWRADRVGPPRARRDHPRRCATGAVGDRVRRPPRRPLRRPAQGRGAARAQRGASLGQARAVRRVRQCACASPSRSARSTPALRAARLIPAMLAWMRASSGCSKSLVA